MIRVVRVDGVSTVKGYHYVYKFLSLLPGTCIGQNILGVCNYLRLMANVDDCAGHIGPCYDSVPFSPAGNICRVVSTSISTTH